MTNNSNKRVINNWAIFFISSLMFFAIIVVIIKLSLNQAWVFSFTNLFDSFKIWGVSVKSNLNIAADVYLLFLIPISLVLILMTMIINATIVKKNKRFIKGDANKNEIMKVSK